MFYACKKSKDGYFSWCKECKRSYKKTPEYLAKSRVTKKKRRDLKHQEYRITERVRELKKFGLTPKSYNDILLSQNESCAICKVHQSKLMRRLCIDHDHNTGKVRQLLCSVCNVGLGHFNDSIELLEVALKYLIRHRS